MWQAIKTFCRRSDVRWNFVIVPLFVGFLLIMLRAWGQLPDVQANIYAYAAKSAGLLIAIALDSRNYEIARLEPAERVPQVADEDL